MNLNSEEILINNKNIVKKYLSFFIKLSVTIFILYFVLSSVPLNEYRHALALFSIQLFTGIFFLVIAQVFTLAYRWHLLAKSAGSKLSVKSSILGILMSFFFSQGLPASIGGDVYRIWWHRREGLSYSVSLKIILFDRIFGLLSLSILCIVSIISLIYSLKDINKILSLAILLGVLGTILILFISPWRIGISRHIEKLMFHMTSKIQKIFRWFMDLRFSTALFMIVYLSLSW